MTDPEMTASGVGEQKLRARNRRKLRITLALFFAGIVAGFTAARMEDIRGYDFAGPWPPEIALGILALFLVAALTGAWLIQREMDDYEKATHRKAAAFASGIVMVGYPTWFLLWKASLVIEPIHWMIFLGTYAAFYSALLYYRYR